MTTTTARKAEPAVVRITKDIDRALSSAAKDFKTTRAQILKSALVEYLQDMADSKAIAEARKKAGKMITHAELKAQLGL
jgi:predicted transcriptional regulator